MISGRIWATNKLFVSSPLFVKFKEKNDPLMDGTQAINEALNPNIN